LAASKLQSRRRCVSYRAPHVLRPFRFFSFTEALLSPMGSSAHPAAPHDLAALLKRSGAPWRGEISVDVCLRAGRDAWRFRGSSTRCLQRRAFDASSSKQSETKSRSSRNSNSLNSRSSLNNLNSFLRGAKKRGAHRRPSWRNTAVLRVGRPKLFRPLRLLRLLRKLRLL
jgi:hypothetical protein